MQKPLVTISIPTRNSAETLPLCLTAIQNQSYPAIEVNIVDAFSSDSTRDIAKKFGVKKITKSKGSLLEARYEGIKHAKGKYVLLLDSDQILEKSAVERAVKLSEKNGIPLVAFEEHVYNPTSLLEKLFEQDRKLINQILDLNPFTGVILPRFYKKSLLEKAIESIPRSVLTSVGGQDHAIIFYEAWLLDTNVSQIPNAVFHIEPKSYLTMWKKFYRWGATSIAAHHPRYDALLQKKERFRTGLFREGFVIASFGSIVLLVMKGIPYKLGYYLGRKNHEKE